MPIKIWVPDTRSAHFLEECKHQSRLVTKADKQDDALVALMDEILADIGGLGE